MQGSERFTVLDVLRAARHVSGEGIGLAPESARQVLEEVERLVGVETAVLAVLGQVEKSGIFPDLITQLRQAVN